MIDEALAIARCGLRVCFTHTVLTDGSCSCGRPTCDVRTRGKHPTRKRWQNEATDDEITLRDHYAELRFVPNISVVLGAQPSSLYLVAIDVDDADRMAALVSQYGELPETMSGRTPRGQRTFFSLPADAPRERVKNISGIGGEPGVDMKAAGGQVVVVGRNSRGDYRGFDPTKPIAELPPAWVLAILVPPKPPADVHEYTPHTLREDARAKKRYQKYIERAVVSECSLLARAKEGQRNDTTYRAAFKLLSLANGMHLPSAWSFVREEVERAAIASGLGVSEARKAVLSAEKAIVESGSVRMPREAPSPSPESSSSSAWSSVSSDDDADAHVKLIEDNGSPAKIAENVARMISLYPRGCPRLNMLKGKPEWPDGSPITDVDEFDLQGWLVSRPHALRVRCGIDAVHGGISLAASRNLFEPVQDFLNLLAWDRVKRLRKFGPTYLSTEDTPYIAAAIQCFFIGSVARAFVPGCQLDTMLILEGDQGLRKTSALRTLAGPDWFSCSPIIIGREPDCYQKLDGVWIYELGEVDGQLKHEQRQQELKGYMTSREDNYRPSYGRNAIRRLRRNSFVGSTNEHKYLADPTGARRYHGVPCGVVKVDEIARDRSQLWAEAVCMYRDGKPWWLDGQLEKDAAAIADLRYLDDPWEERLPLVLAEREVTTTAEMLYLLGVDPGKFDRATATKAGIALRRAGGWRRVEGPPPTGGSARYHYVRIHGKYV